MAECSITADNVFGPVVDRNCRGGFDFTLLFEQSILGLLPSALFGLAFASRLVHLAKTETKTLSSSARLLKLTIASILPLLNLCLVVLYSISNPERTVASLPFAIVNLIVSFQFLALSWMEDIKSIQPSSTLSAYLVFTLLPDITQSRTLWLRSSNTPIAAVFTASIAAKATLLILESCGKQSHLRPAYKNIPPEFTGGVINRSFLWWVNQVFKRGLRALLTYEDLFVLDKDLTTAGLSVRIEDAWSKRRRPERRFEYPLVACRALWYPLLLAIFPRLCLIGFTFAQPFLIFRVLDILSMPQDMDSENSGYGLIGAAALIYLGLAVSTLHYNQGIYRFITMFRGATIALIYHHMLSLPIGAYDESAAMTLMSTDVDRIALCLAELNECWARLIEVAIGITLLALQLKWVSIVPVILVIISSLGSGQISKTIGGRQKVWVEAVQDRITVTASVLSEMRSIKMMGLSRLFTSIIQNKRVEETHRMAGYRWSIVWQNVVQNLPWEIAPAFTFSIYVAQAAVSGKASLQTTQVFTSLAVITLLADPVSKLLSAIPSTASSFGCFDRIQKFLVDDLRIDSRVISSAQEIPFASDAPMQLDTNLELAMLPKHRETCRGSLPAISIQGLTLRPAKSAGTILSNINLDITPGSLAIISGPVGCGKTTLLKAILGESSPNESGTIQIASTRIAFCSQTAWLPNTTIQQAIKGPEELETTPDKVWYEKCLHACDLECDIAALQSGDETQIGSASTVLSGGQKLRITLARALYARPDIMLLDDVFSGLDSKTRATIMKRLFGESGFLKRLGTTVVLVTHSTEIMHYTDKILVIADGSVQQKPVSESTISEAVSETPEIKSHFEAEVFSSQRTEKSTEVSEEVSKTNELDDLTRATGDLAVYRYYFRCVGWPNTALFVGLIALNVFCNSFSHVWLKWWADIGGGQIALYMAVYLGLAFISILALGSYIWAIIVYISPFTAREFHRVLLNSVMSAPMAFFSNTDTGSILNRFSQDMTLIETQLATGVLTTVSNLLGSLAAAALVATGSTYMAATIPLLVLVVWALQHVYLRTSRQVRLLDIEARSPLFSHFLETMNGMTTIRAFGWQSHYIARNHRLLDHSQRPYYLLYCIQRWLNLVLDLIVGAEAVLVVGLAVGLRRSTSPGLLGVSLNNILSFSSSLSSLLSGWTLLETSLGSIARLKSFEEAVHPEDKHTERLKQPPPRWPDHGVIEYKDVTASHKQGAVGIHNVSLKVTSGQRIGICGRTGSGKSSLIGTLLRLLEIENGQIFVDGIDLCTLPRDLVRERFLVIPQDPMIIPGSLRLNIDPHQRTSSNVIKQSLERVGLWEHVTRSADGLDTEITAATLSRGQQQLLALARVLVKKREEGGRILLLDEATSSVDRDTDEIMQRVVREEFSDCTTIMVAHRLDTVLDCDLVFVMEDGRVVEIGEPNELLRKEGWFSQLAGSKMDISLK